jgi:sec-independent protein translocase protein TatB
MFGMSFGELAVVLVLALLVVGPQNLPKAARQLGRAYSWARHHMAVLQREINLELRRLEMQELEKKLGPNSPPPTPPPPGPPYEEKAEAGDEVAATAAPARDLTATGNPQRAAEAVPSGAPADGERRA